MSTLPAAIGLSHLSVYDDSGSPHMHVTCSEAYVVTGGAGSVQTLGPDGFREEPLAPRDVVWFEPGIIHRLVNGGGLELVVVMQNSGLPEAGDAVFTFPPAILADPDEYARRARIGSEAEALARRDLAIAGFEALDDLEAFYGAALALVAPRLDAWEQRWREGALAAAERTGVLLEAARAGDTSRLREAALTRAQTAPRLGMCGRLESVL